MRRLDAAGDIRHLESGHLVLLITGSARDRSDDHDALSEAARRINIGTGKLPCLPGSARTRISDRGLELPRNKFQARVRGEPPDATNLAPSEDSRLFGKDHGLGGLPAEQPVTSSVERMDDECNGESERRDHSDQRASVFVCLGHHRVGQHRQDRAGRKSQHERDGVL